MHYERMSRTVPILLATTLMAAPAWTAEDGDHFHHHHVSVVAGGAFRAEKPQSAAFLGAEYEYAFNRKLGLAVYYEETVGGFELQAIGALVVWHPAQGLKLAVGAAVERKLGDQKNKGLIRLQAAYDFHAGKVTFGPMLVWDLIEDETNVAYLGFGVGYGF